MRSQHWKRREHMQENVDLLILGGQLVAMDDAGTLIDDGGVAIKGDRIAAVGPSQTIRDAYAATRTLDATRKVIMPGLVDTYGHAGHGLIRGFYHPDRGWPAWEIYWHKATDDWWFAEAQLAATERLRFGVTTGASIIGSTPARADSPIFGIRNAEAYSKVGVRAVLGVGPPDPFISHIPSPWSGSFLEDGEWVERQFTYDEAVSNSIEVIKAWHNGADGRIKIALAPAYIFGRHAFERRYQYAYEPDDIPVMIEKADEIRDLAGRYQVQIHTHLGPGAVDFALEHYGRDRVERLLGPDVVLAHSNGLEQREVDILGATRSNVAYSPSTAENLWYGYAPVVEMLEAGANVAIATDGAAPRFSFDLWKDIHRGMWHQWIKHKTQHVMPPGKALRMVTIDAARALGIGDETGSLEAGKKADVILVDLNRPHLTPTTFVPQLLTYYVNGNDVDTTIVDGKVLMHGGEITSVNVQDVIDQGREEAERAFGQVDLSEYVEITRDFWHGARY
jgi:5-methylthioadenosine/S-adenosylhomocysteine deaminase